MRDFLLSQSYPCQNSLSQNTAIFSLSDTYLKAQATEPFSIPKYEFAVGTAVRNVVQDLMTPEDASRMAQALYDAADPVLR